MGLGALIYRNAILHCLVLVLLVEVGSALVFHLLGHPFDQGWELLESLADQGLAPGLFEELGMLHKHIFTGKPGLGVFLEAIVYEVDELRRPPEVLGQGGRVLVDDLVEHFQLGHVGVGHDTI